MQKINDNTLMIYVIYVFISFENFVDLTPYKRKLVKNINDDVHIDVII